jgi:enterochelin esterase-like enzyme
MSSGIQQTGDQHMNSMFITVLFAVFMTVGTCLAQTEQSAVVEDFKPSVNNQSGKQYPQVNSEGRARFRIVAPQAQSVRVGLGGRGGTPLVKGEDGAWVGTTAPLDEGFHYYTITIDGAEVPDPGTRYFYGVSRWGSAIEVPAKDQDFYALKDVPHGQVREHLYLSKIANAWRRCFVYTPPDYDRNTSARFPVLYLQHGSGEDETGWAVQGRANLILDNLIAGKKAVPMIIVMENGSGNLAPAADATIVRTPATGTPGRGGASGGGISAFENVLINEVIPMIDASYRTLPDREHRAMAGLSMGANQTIQITMNNLDKFSHIGGFSGTSNYPNTTEIDPATFMNGKFKDGVSLNKQIKLFWLGLGTKEPDPFPDSVGAFKAMLDKVGVKYVYYESPGTAHEWLTWRRDLYQFAPLLFRD